VAGGGVKEGAGSPSNASVCPLRTSRGEPSSSLFFGLKNRGWCWGESGKGKG